jgi:hypothetical protein
MGSCGSSSNESNYTSAMDTVESCHDKATAAMANGDSDAALDWLMESLRIQAAVKKARERQAKLAYCVDYSEMLFTTLLEIGQLHFSRGNEDDALVYFHHALKGTEAFILPNSSTHSTALKHYVEACIGMSFVYIAAAVKNEADSRRLGQMLFRINPSGVNLRSNSTVSQRRRSSTALRLIKGDPLLGVERMIKNAIDLVTRKEGARSMHLVSLLHLLARVYVLLKQPRQALRAMQWCLGLVISNSNRAIDGPEALVVTKTVIRGLKAVVRRIDAAETIQRFWRRIRMLKFLKHCFHHQQQPPEENLEAARAIFEDNEPDTPKTQAGATSWKPPSSDFLHKLDMEDHEMEPYPALDALVGVDSIHSLVVKARNHLSASDEHVPILEQTVPSRRPEELSVFGLWNFPFQAEELRDPEGSVVERGQ